MKTLLIIMLFIFGQPAHSAASVPDCNKNNNSNSKTNVQDDPLPEHIISFSNPFRLLTWNVNLMTSWWIGIQFLYYCNNQDMNDILTRAQSIADRLKEKNYDMIALQELADYTSKKIIDRTLNDAGYFASQRLGEYQSHVGNTYYLFNAGITLYSKHPFITLEYHPFSRAAGLQSFMPKGVVYGKIVFHDRMIHLFSLHLQSIQNGSEQEYEVLKSHQNELKELIQSKQIDPTDHVFLLGDFNVNAQNYLPEEERSSAFQEMLNILDAKEAAPFMDCNPQISFDPERNPMAKGKIPAGTLDNILCINSPVCPYTGSKRIFRFEDTTTRLKELSDHYPIEATVYIP